MIGLRFALTSVAVVALAGAGCHREAGAVMIADAPVRCPPGVSAGSAPLDVALMDVSGTFRSAWATATRGTGRQSHSLLLHWDGCGWREEPSPVTDGRVPELRAVWSDGKDVWVSGGQMLFRRLEGWPVVSPTTRVAQMWGSGPNDIWMRGDLGYGAVTHWNGAQLESERIEGMAGNVTDLWGTGPNDVWVAGGEFAARRDAKGWQVWKVSEHGWGTHGAGGGRDVWVSTPDAFQHWDGRSWSRVEGFGWESVWKMGTIGDGIYAWTSHGELLLRTAAGWSVVGTLRPWTHPSAVHANTWRAFFTVGNEAWVDSAADGVQGVMRRHAGKWIPVGAAAGVPRAEDVVALWSDGRSTLWAAVSFRVGLSAPAGEIRRLDRGQSTWIRAATLDQFPTAIHGRAPDDVWVVGFGGATWHWDGKSWRSIPTGAHQNLYAVWAAAPDDVWVNGERGVRFNWDGKAWRRWLEGAWPAWGASALAGTGTRDIWSAGGNFIAHWDGRGWGARQEGDDATVHQGTGQLFSLFAAGPDDVWAVGTGGETEPEPGGRHPGERRALPRPLILHWTGRAWARLSRPDANPTAKVLRAVSGTSATNVWAVGDAGTILHWDGKRWSTVSPSTHENLTAVAVDANGRVWIGGNNGTLLRLD